MATFKTTVKDGVSLPFVYQSAQSKTTEPLVTLEFRNRDEDTQQVYQMARIDVLDSKANASENGFGTISFATSSNGFLTEALRITDENFVGIGLSNPTEALSVNGNVSVLGSVSATNVITASSLQVTEAIDVASGGTGTSSLPIDRLLIGGGSNAITTDPGTYFSVDTLYAPNVSVTGSVSGASVSAGTLTVSSSVDNDVLFTGNVVIQGTLTAAGVVTTQATISNLDVSNQAVINYLTLLHDTVSREPRKLTSTQSNNYSTGFDFIRDNNRTLESVTITSFGSASSYDLRIYNLTKSSVVAEETYSNISPEDNTMVISGDDAETPNTFEIQYRTSGSNQVVYINNIKCTYS